MHRSFKFWYSTIYLFLCLLVVFLVSYPRNHCQIQCPEAFLLCFLQKFYSFMSHIYIFDPLWINIFNIREGSTFILLYMDIQFCQYHLLILISVEKIVLSLSFGILVKNHFATYTRVYYLFCSIGLYTCIMPIPHHLITGAL